MLDASEPVQLQMKPILMGLPLGAAAPLPPAVVALAPPVLLAADVGDVLDFDDDEHATAAMTSASKATPNDQRRAR